MQKMCFLGEKVRDIGSPRGHYACSVDGFSMKSGLAFRIRKTGSQPALKGTHRRLFKKMFTIWNNIFLSTWEICNLSYFWMKYLEEIIYNNNVCSN